MYGGRLAAQQKDERPQDNDDKKWLARHHLSDFLRSLTREQIGRGQHSVVSPALRASPFWSFPVLRVRHLMRMCIPSFIPLCSPVMPIMLLKLTYYSKIMLKFFSVHRQNISFLVLLVAMSFHQVCVQMLWDPVLINAYHTSLDVHKTSGPMRVHALNRGPCLIITSSCGEGFEAPIIPA